MNKKDWRYLCTEKDKILFETQLLIDKSRSVHEQINEINIVNQVDVKNVFKILTDDTFEFNYYYATVGLLQLVAPTKEIRDLWKASDILLKKFLGESLNDSKFYNQIKKLKATGNFNKTEILFIDTIINSYKKNGIDANDKNRLIKFKTYRDDLEKSIINNFSKIVVTMYDTHDKRKQETLINYDKSSRAIKDFLKLILCKREINKLVGIKHDINSSTMLQNMLSQTSDKMMDILTDIKNNMNKKEKKTFTLIDSDINEYLQQLKKHTSKLIPNNVLDNIFEIINNKFGIKMEFVKNVQAWDPNVKLIAIKDTAVRGYLYLDLIHRDNKIQQPLCITLNNKFMYKDTIRLPSIALITDYSSMTTPILSYNDVVLLFKEFGQIIHHIFNDSVLGIVNMNMDTDIMEYIMEFVAWHPDTIKKMYGNENTDKLTMARTIEQMCDLRKMCINALFGNLIETSDTCVKFIKNLLKENSNVEATVHKLYKELYNEFACKFKDVYDYEFARMDGNVMISLMGNKHMRVSNYVTAYNVFNNITNNRTGLDFRNNVLEKSDLPFKQLIDKWLATDNKKIQLDNDDNYFTETC